MNCTLRSLAVSKQQGRTQFLGTAEAFSKVSPEMGSCNPHIPKSRIAHDQQPHKVLGRCKGKDQTIFVTFIRDIKNTKCTNVHKGYIHATEDGRYSIETKIVASTDVDPRGEEPKKTSQRRKQKRRNGARGYPIKKARRQAL